VLPSTSAYRKDDGANEMLVFPDGISLESCITRGVTNGFGLSKR
jgi:hypothetical protein